MVLRRQEAKERQAPRDQRQGRPVRFHRNGRDAEGNRQLGRWQAQHESTMDFLHDLRGRVIGQPEISTDGFHPYRVAIRDTFGDNASHGVIVKTYSVTHLSKEAATR